MKTRYDNLDLSRRRKNPAYLMLLQIYPDAQVFVVVYVKELFE